MIRCEFVENNSKVVVKEEKQTVLEMSVLFDADRVWADVEYISDSKNEELSKGNNYMGNYFTFINEVFAETKKTLQEQGMSVERVLLGSMSEVRKLDEFSRELDEDYLRKETKSIVANKR